jgi:hypothetical protein
VQREVDSKIPLYGAGQEFFKRHCPFTVLQKHEIRRAFLIVPLLTSMAVKNKRAFLHQKAFLFHPNALFLCSSQKQRRTGMCQIRKAVSARLGVCFSIYPARIPSFLFKGCH